MDIITVDRDGELASEILREEYEEGREIAMYTCWSRVRQLIASNGWNRNKFYYQKLEALLENPDL